MRCRVWLYPEEPLLVGSGAPVQNVQVGRDSLPGSAWRGALADGILRRAGAKSPGKAAVSAPPSDFDLAFREDAHFGFLYPVPGEGWEGFPLPLTARSCKAQPGFLREGPGEADAKAGHGIVDTLLGRLRQHLGISLGRETRCRVCDERLDRRRGLAARALGGDGDRSGYREVKVRRKLMLRVGLDRRTETAAEGILYALDAVVPRNEPRLCYAGTWRGDREQLAALQRLLDGACPSTEAGWLVRLGTARARGLGKARLEIRPLTGESLPPLADRLEAFRQRLRSPYGASQSDFLYFALTLRSPLLVRDAAGVPAGRPEAAALAAYVGALPALEYVEAASAVEWEVWDGWAMAWGLPKPLVTAVAPGSVLVYRAPAKERETVLAFLEEVEEKGLGERRSEGWGEVVACDPFHVLFDGEEEAVEG